MGELLGQAIAESKAQRGQLWFLPTDGHQPPERLGECSEWEGATVLQIVETLRPLPVEQRQAELDRFLRELRWKVTPPTPLHPEVEP